MSFISLFAALIVSIANVPLLQAGPLLSGQTKNGIKLDVDAIETADKPAFLKIMANESVLAQANANLTSEEAVEWFEALVAGHGLLGFTLKLTKTDTVIGFMVLEEKPSGYWETSSGLEQEYRSGGFGTLARQLTTDYVLGTLRIRGLQSRVSVSNPASIAVTKKLNFVFTGKTTKPKAQVRRPEVWDDYRLSRETFLKEKPALVQANIDDETKRLLKREPANPLHYYDMLMADGWARQNASPEQLNRLAEDLATKQLSPETKVVLKKLRMKRADFGQCERVFE